MIREKIGATSVEVETITFDESSCSLVICLDAEIDGSPITFEESDEEWLC